MVEAQNNINPKMTRRAIREAVFKLLYIAEFNTKEEMEEQLRIFFESAGAEGETPFGNTLPNSEDIDTVYSRYDKVRENQEQIDELLNKTSEGWKTSRMSKVDLSILRLAVYEALYDDTIPVKVAINEAVEIAKRFGGDDSRAFVNGILGKIVKNKEN